MSSRKAFAIRQFVAVTLAVLAALFVFGHCTACSGAQAKPIAQDVLSATQVLCVLASNFTDDKTIAEACQIDQALIPLIRPLISAKETVAAKARRAPRLCTDAGGP
jgi:hypothetical protein